MYVLNKFWENTKILHQSWSNYQLIIITIILIITILFYLIFFSETTTFEISFIWIIREIINGVLNNKFSDNNGLIFI